MKCVILAAGYATRLYPLTEHFPKPLLPVGKQTILDRLLADIGDAAESFIVVSNHRFAPIFRDWAAKQPLPVEVLDDGTDTNETRLGAVRDILFAVEACGLTGDTLVMAGDNVLTFSLRPFLAYSREKGASCVLCHPENDPARQRKTGLITVDEAWRITSYEEKPTEPRGNLAVPPFYYYRGEDLALIPQALAEGPDYLSRMADNLALLRQALGAPATED